MAPLERLKILMQIQGGSGSARVYTGVWQGTRHMWRSDGLRGMFKGNGLNCIRIVPNQGAVGWGGGAGGGGKGAAREPQLDI